MATASVLHVDPALTGEPPVGFGDEVLTVADRFNIRNLLPHLHEQIRQLFPGTVTVRVDWDPEIPDDPKICFLVRSSLSFEERLERQRLWFRKVRELAGAASLHFNLTLQTQDRQRD